MPLLRSTAVLVVTLIGWAAASAAVTVGGRSYADNAFADAVTLPVVDYFIWDGATANVVPVTSDAAAARAAMLDTPLTAPSLATSTFAACSIGQDEAACGVVTVSFVDNVVVNGPGADFAIYDINSPSDFKVTIDGVTLVRSTAVVGTTPRPPALGSDPWLLNAAEFDLSDFGLASGATADAFGVHWGLGATTASRGGIALVAAVNSVPEPATVLLLAAGVAGVAAAARRRR